LLFVQPHEEEDTVLVKKQFDVFDEFTNFQGVASIQIINAYDKRVAWLKSVFFITYFSYLLNDIRQLLLHAVNLAHLRRH